MNLPATTATLLYLVATIVLLLKRSSLALPRPAATLSGCGALLLHAYCLVAWIFVSSGLNFSFFNAISLVAWLIPLTVLLATLFRPLENLLLIAYPAAIISILLALLFPNYNVVSAPVSIGLWTHIILSVCAYSFLIISTFQALVLALQERMIKTKRADKIINILPPLRVMENLMIELLVIGFFLLSLSLASGAMFISDLFAQHLVHKTVLSVVAWIVYGMLLWGRWQRGWRGQYIIRWVLGGAILLILAYFGSKFVLELLLQRT